MTYLLIIDQGAASSLVIDDTTISWYRGGMTTSPRTNAATAARRRIGQETMAAKLRAAGWLVVAEPRCGTCGGDLDSMGDMTVCVKCGDEFEDPETMWDRAIAEARKELADR